MADGSSVDVSLLAEIEYSQVGSKIQLLMKKMHVVTLLHRSLLRQLIHLCQ